MVRAHSTLEFMPSILKKLNISQYLGKYWAGAEAMYSVIIVMTFTSTLRSISLVSVGLYSTVLYSALYCCIAWGLADGCFYAWEDAYNANTHKVLIEDSKLEEKKPVAVSMVKEELDDTIIGSIQENDREKLYDGIVGYLSKNKVKKESKSAFFRALPHYLLGTSVLAIGAGVIVLLPFLIIRGNLPLALRVSNVVGILALFAIGYYRASGNRLSQRLSSGMVSALLGIIIAVVTVLLGG